MIKRRITNSIAMISASIMLVAPIQAKIEYVTHRNEVDIATQFATGTYSSTNCGIASLKMAIDFLDIEGLEDKTVEELRNEIKPEKGLIYTNELEDYMDEQSIDYEVEKLNSKQDILDAVDDGIVVLCLDMSKVKDVPYDGHYITIVGKYLEGSTKVLEVYDSMHSTTQYYDLITVYESSKEWWGYMFTFEQDDTSTNTVSQNNDGSAGSRTVDEYGIVYEGIKNINLQIDQFIVRK